MWFNMICNEGLYTINEGFPNLDLICFVFKNFLNKSFETKNSFDFSHKLYIHEYIQSFMWLQTLSLNTPTEEGYQLTT